ncbi:hypothetical protein SLS64_011606 [Diaporthe eres]
MADCIPNYKDAVWSFYRYEPSVAGAVIFCILLGITSGLHAFQMYTTRTWYLIALVVGGLCECIGYIARSVNATEQPGCWSLGAYIAQNVLILIAPAFMAASIYMILGRIIILTDGDSHSLVRRRWITKIFVTGGVSSLQMQSTGGGLMAAGESLLKTGENIIIAGLFVQLAFFGFFVVAAGVFHRRMSLVPTAKASDPAVRWQKYLMTLYVTSALILVRSIFRVI